RAIAVEQYFEGLGLTEGQLIPAGLGDRDPVAPNTTAANKQRNRRVEIIIESKVVNETLQQAGLDDKVAVPPTPDSLNPGVNKPVGKPVSGSAPPSVSPNLGAG